MNSSAIFLQKHPKVKSEAWHFQNIRKLQRNSPFTSSTFTLKVNTDTTQWQRFSNMLSLPFPVFSLHWLMRLFLVLTTVHHMWFTLPLFLHFSYFLFILYAIFYPLFASLLLPTNGHFTHLF